MNRDLLKAEELLEKIRGLSPDKIAEVVDFVDFLASRSSDRRLTKAVEKLSGPAFERVWDNADDTAYDRL